MARKLVPEIDRLHEQGFLTEQEHRALHYYRDQASLADRSPTRSCLDFSPRGGHGPGVAITSALLETGRIERDFGSVREVARAIAVDDMSLRQWAIRTSGGTEQSRGNVIEIIPNDPFAEKIALLELKYAAGTLL
jgi:hypothetical protein